MNHVPRWVFVHSSDELYGADRVLLRILRALPADVASRALVLVPDDVAHGPLPLCQRIEAEGIAVEHAPLPILRRALLTPSGLAGIAHRRRDLARRLRSRYFDNLYVTTSAGAPALTVTAERRFLHVQEVWAGKESTILAQFARRAHRIVAVSRAAEAALPGWLRPRTRIVPNAVDDPVLRPTFRSVTDVAEEPLRFLAAGRWTPRKGLAELLAAWERSGGPGHLVVAGGAPPSGRTVDLAAQVLDMTHGDSVHLVGEVADLDPFMSQCHVVVVPSIEPESFGLVALEGMAAGRLVIASRIGALEEVVGETGCLVPAGSVRLLANALRSVTYAGVVDMGGASRRRYLVEFSPDSFVRNWRRAVAG